jgi:hypothetical protein
MSQIDNLIDSYIDDSSHYDDFDDNIIKETLNGLKETLNSLTESNIQEYAKAFKNYKKSLTNSEKKEICEDFIQYAKHSRFI